MIKQIKRYNVDNLYLMAITFFIVATVIIKSFHQNNASYVFQLENLAIALICSIALYTNSTRPFSLYKIFHLFFLFFFCVAPGIQHQNHTEFQGLRLNPDDYMMTSGVLLIILILFNVLYIVGEKRKMSLRTIKVHHAHILDSKKEGVLICVSLLVLLIMLYYNKFNLVSFFVRDLINFERESFSKTTSLLINNFLRPICMIIFLSSSIIGTKHKWVKWSLFFLALLVCSPTGMPRFETAALYIPLLLWFFPVFRRKNIFIITFIAGLLIIFPFLNNFRHFSSIKSINDIGFNFSQFEDLHFDAYFMFAQVLKMRMITDGQQLLGVLFFWVPRIIWPDKPIGSGQMIAEKTHMSYTNLSMPYFAEGYINFGYIGIIIFVIIIVYFVLYWDRLFWRNIRFQKSNINQLIYFLLIGLFLFTLRGDLLSGFSYTCGITASFYSIRWICSNKKNKV